MVVTEKEKVLTKTLVCAIIRTRLVKGGEFYYYLEILV